MSNQPWEVSPDQRTANGKTIQDIIYFEGMYNPALRFAFTNVLDKDFVSGWNSNPYIIKPNSTVKVPHHLAVKFTKEIVDILMDEDKKGLQKAVPAVRKAYEDRVLKFLPPENAQELEIIKNDFVQQIRNDASRLPGVPDEPVQPPQMDFEDLRPQNFGDKPKKKK